MYQKIVNAAELRETAGAGVTSTHSEHLVRCWHCGEMFDLVRAAWCGCGVRVDMPSKRCPHCLQCACEHPDYLNNALWGEAPRYLKRKGFSRLFYLYL